MADGTMLAQELGALLGPGGVLGPGDDLARYAQDWPGDHQGRPLLVARPRNVEEVQAVVRRCAEAGVPVVPQGGHTGLVDGATPSEGGDELVLSLERMNRIRAIDPLDFSMVVEAGCVLAEAKRAAEEVDLFFPLSLGAQGSCRIGGNIATNAGGLNVLRYGMTRELVLGLEVVLPDGSLLEDLRCLRKNNTGYDLKQLFIGSEGTLGVVTAAALKLWPKPVAKETVLLGCPSVEALVELYGRARRELGDLLSAFELLTRPCIEAALEEVGAAEPFAPQPVYALAEATTSARIPLRDAVEGFLADAMEAGLVADGAVAESEAQAASFWRLREGLIEWQVRRGRHLRTDVGVAVSAVPGFVAEVEEALRVLEPGLVVHSYGHVGDGNVHVNAVPPAGMAEADKVALIGRAEATVYRVVDAFGGTISAEHGIGRKKKGAFLQRVGATERALSERIRGAVDPRGIMSPGRIF